MIRDKRAEELVQKEKYDTSDLIDLVALLRSENGCPWDRVQTHQSVRKHLIEETYEVVEAIDNDDMKLMREELGDLLFQVVFHAQIAAEDGAFTFDDVVDDVCKKMIIRHPHVFGDLSAETEGEIRDNWDMIKMQTKDQSSVCDVLDGVSRSLPSLMRAKKIAGKAKKGGLDSRTPEQIIGDVLYGVSEVCSELDIDPEKALYDSCERAIERAREEERKDNNET